MMLNLSNPRYRPPAPIVARLNAAVAQEIAEGRETVFAKGERRRLSDHLAMDASRAALASLEEAKISVVDANELRQNQPGYDLLVDGHIRIQVKGGTYVDSIGFAHTAAKVTAADLNYDVLFLVDVGCILDPRGHVRQAGGDSRAS